MDAITFRLLVQQLEKVNNQMQPLASIPNKTKEKVIHHTPTSPKTKSPTKFTMVEAFPKTEKEPAPIIGKPTTSNQDASIPTSKLFLLQVNLFFLVSQSLITANTMSILSHVQSKNKKEGRILKLLLSSTGTVQRKHNTIPKTIQIPY